MDKYTFKNIIIDPTEENIESLIGKEVYISDVPKYCLCHANKNDSEYLAVLKAIRKDHVCPFLVKRQNINYEEAYSCIIVKKEPCYEDQVKQWIEENNIKVGDYVKVTRRAENHADGLDDYWYDLMGDSVGKILKVKEISNFIMLDNGINYPYFVLEKVEEPKPKYVPFETLDEFIESYKKVEERINYSKAEDYIASCGMWLKDKDRDVYCLVTEIWNYGVVVGDSNMNTTKDGDEYFTFNEVTKWKRLFMEYTFLDDTPCGKEVEE